MPGADVDEPAAARETGGDLVDGDGERLPGRRDRVGNGRVGLAHQADELVGGAEVEVGACRIPCLCGELVEPGLVADRRHVCQSMHAVVEWSRPMLGSRQPSGPARRP